MDVLVTGASGFVGAVVAQELHARGVAVTGLVRSPLVIEMPGIKTVCADLTDYDSVDRALSNSIFDAVVDTASKIPTANSVDEDYLDNILMTRNLLRVLKKHLPGYFIKLSTIDVYKTGGVITEQSEISLQNYYALSKWASEQNVELWGRELKIPTCILRLSQIFGAGDRTRKFIPSIIQSIKERSKIYINGDGLERRDYVYIRDAGSMIADFCRMKAPGVFNLASGKSRSLNEVVEILQDVCDTKFQIEYRKRNKPRIDYEFDVTHLTAMLGEIKSTPFSEALRNTYFQMKL